MRKDELLVPARSKLGAMTISMVSLKKIRAFAASPRSTIVAESKGPLRRPRATPALPGREAVPLDVRNDEKLVKPDRGNRFGLRTVARTVIGLLAIPAGPHGEVDWRLRTLEGGVHVPTI